MSLYYLNSFTMIMRNTILAIIDMQPSFPASQNASTILICQEEIRNAIKNMHYIFFVEWDGEGSTDSRLTSLTNNYSDTHFVYKNQNDGSSKIMSKVYSLGIVNSKFRICGVNTDACVKDTVIGLSEHGRIGRSCEVIGRGCNTDWGNHVQTLRNLKTIPNVKVI